jgi:hypothetical protein
MATTRLGKERAIAATRLHPRSAAGSWILPGALMGIAAGGVFLIFEMTAAGIMGQSAFGPFRMIAAIVLGEGVLPVQSTVDLAIVVPVALAVHYALSAFYGAVFSTVAAVIGALHNGRMALVVAASVFGFVLWLANFYAIAPALFPWFLMANPMVQFIAHTFFFGTALGLMLGIRLGGEQRGIGLGRAKI